MKLSKVTMTGADDSIPIQWLFEISNKYPFVEWGILLSRKSKGANRFPSQLFLDTLYKYDTGYSDVPLVKFSGHLCGSYVKEILMGDFYFIEEIGHAWKLFQRVQINTHGIAHNHDAINMLAALKSIDKEIIFQYDNVNTSILADARMGGVHCSTLFDLSHGYGTLPNQWPEPIANLKCGYAGGLSPDNIEQQLKLIEGKVGDGETWIDMETHIRSNDDQQFDLWKVEKVLEICKKYV